MKLGSIRAEVIPVPQTNLFLALINENCDPQHPIQACFIASASIYFCLSITNDGESYCGVTIFLLKISQANEIEIFTLNFLLVFNCRCRSPCSFNLFFNFRVHFLFFNCMNFGISGILSLFS